LLPNDIVKQQEKDPTCIDTVAVTWFYSIATTICPVR
jgi:hypothetical protein